MTSWITEDREKAYGENVEPIPFAGLVQLNDKEDREEYLRDQIRILQADNQRLRKRLIKYGCND
jgi:hypothetical protein